MMVIAALVLLGTLSLGVNGTIVTSSSTSLEMEADLDALSYGQSLMDEIMDRAFDQNVIASRKFNNSDMSIYLGPDGSEVFTLPDSSATGKFKSDSLYNDVDDYNGYVRKVWNSRLDVFTLTVSIHYTQLDAPFTVQAGRSFSKDIVIDVTNPYMSFDDSSPKQQRIELRGLSVYRKYF